MTTRRHERDEELKQHEPMDEHECEFEDVVEGSEVFGKVFIICGAVKDYSEDER